MTPGSLDLYRLTAWLLFLVGTLAAWVLGLLYLAGYFS